MGVWEKSMEVWKYGSVLVSILTLSVLYNLFYITGVK